MPLPERLKPIKINRSIMKDKLDLLEQITIKIDSGAKEDNTELNLMMKTGTSKQLKFMSFQIFVIIIHGQALKSLQRWHLIKPNI